MRQQRFAATAFFIWSGLLIWMSDFLFVYVFAALACARGFAHIQLLGMAIVPLVTVASTLLAGLVTGSIMWQAARQTRSVSDADAHLRFVHFIACAVDALALVALLLIALPPLIVAGSCS